MKGSAQKYDLELALITAKALRCELCGGRTRQVCFHTYVCDSCGHEQSNDFVKIRRYIEEHGPADIFTISKETGVSLEIINIMIERGLMGYSPVVENERVKKIKSFCNEFRQLQMQDNINKEQSEEIKEPVAKMYFLNRNQKDRFRSGYAK